MCVMRAWGKKKDQQMRDFLASGKQIQEGDLFLLVSFVHVGQHIYKPHLQALNDGDLSKRSNTCDTDLGCSCSVCRHSSHSGPEMSLCLLQWPWRTKDRIHRNLIYKEAETTCRESNKRTLSLHDGSNKSFRTVDNQIFIHQENLSDERCSITIVSVFIGLFFLHFLL